MAHGGRCFPTQGFVGADVIDVRQILRSLQPKGWRGALPVEENLSVLFNPLDGPHFGGILLGMMGFGVFIADEVFAVELQKFEARLDSGIVAAQAGGCALGPEEIFIGADGMTFGKVTHKC